MSGFRASPSDAGPFEKEELSLVLPVIDRRIDQILSLQPSINIAGYVRIIEAEAPRIYLIAESIILVIGMGCCNEGIATTAIIDRFSGIRHDLVSPIRLSNIQRPCTKMVRRFAGIGARIEIIGESLPGRKGILRNKPGMGRS